MYRTHRRSTRLSQSAHPVDLVDASDHFGERLLNGVLRRSFDDTNAILVVLRARRSRRRGLSRGLAVRLGALVPFWLLAQENGHVREPALRRREACDRSKTLSGMAGKC